MSQQVDLDLALKKLNELSTDINGNINTDLFGLNVNRKFAVHHPAVAVRLPVVEFKFETIYLFHKKLSKGRVLYQLMDTEPLLGGDLYPTINMVNGYKVVSDGNHRVAALTLLGFDSFKFHYRS
jgi:hypothetical protein